MYEQRIVSTLDGSKVIYRIPTPDENYDPDFEDTEPHIDEVLDDLWRHRK